MKSFFTAGRVLAMDMASTLLLLIVLGLTGNAMLAVGLAIALGLGQIAWEAFTRRPIEPMQWMSLFLVVIAGGASLLTHDVRFVMAKPSVIYIAIGVVMSKRGWMNRYLPPEAIEFVPDLGILFGYIWAGLMFASAILNIVLVFSLDAKNWALTMSIYGLVSKAGLFTLQFSLMRVIGRRRYRAAVAIT